MDPIATIRDFDLAEADRDREAIAVFADAMVGWLEKGGFMPIAPEGDWRRGLTRGQALAHFRTVRAIAEMR